ncbi:MAG: hypothetical protein DKINENOH_00128 [bacterium]|nr:hypothetical protein [bacterium]
MSALSLKEHRAAADLADFFYDFLPGSGHSSWKGHVSFKAVAEKVGVDDFWQEGSKLPMITALLTRTLEHKRHLFERLILEIVRSGIVYKQKQGKPVTPEDLDKLNGFILEIGFKFPDLWDPEFRNSLRLEGGQRAKERVEQALKEEKIRASTQSEKSIRLLDLKNKLFSLSTESNRQKAGLEFEKILNRLFALHGLAPREPFRIIGEQIDGSIDLDHETYLVEAKWTKEPIPEAELLIFRGKVEGKSLFTRGVFISMSGISPEAKEAIVRGKQSNFFVVDGYDLTMVLSEEIGLIDFLRERRRLLADEGLVSVPYSELWKGTRSR